MKLLTITFILFSIAASAQLPFQDEIDEFKKEDKATPPPQNPVLFVGSSSFRLWKDLPSDFPGYTILNRAFGGSTFEDLLNFTNDVVMPYKAKQVIVYCGDNDLAKGDSPEVVFQRFKEFYSRVRKGNGAAKFTYVAIKPSPSRIHLLGKAKKANGMIKDFLGKEKNTSFVDIFTPMLDENGNPREELFIEDELHMNRQGYDIWKKALQSHLIK